MGSWNDTSFVGKEGREYDRVSEVLYTRLVDCILGAANTSTPGAYVVTS